MEGMPISRSRVLRIYFEGSHFLRRTVGIMPERSTNETIIAFRHIVEKWREGIMIHIVLKKPSIGFHVHDYAIHF